MTETLTLHAWKIYIEKPPNALWECKKFCHRSLSCHLNVHTNKAMGMTFAFESPVMPFMSEESQSITNLNLFIILPFEAGDKSKQAAKKDSLCVLLQDA